MSLDARIQQIARSEVARATGSDATAADVAEQVRDLHEHLHRALTLIDGLTRRVEELEKAATAQDDDTSASRAATARRTKTARGSG